VQRHSSPYSTACSQATSAHPGPLRLCPRVHFRHCVRRDDRLDAPSRQCHCRLFVAEKRRHREESRPCAWAFGRRADQQAERVVVRFQRKHVPYRPDADQDTTVTYRFWERTVAAVEKRHWNRKERSIWYSTRYFTTGRNELSESTTSAACMPSKSRPHPPWCPIPGSVSSRARLDPH